MKFLPLFFFCSVACCAAQIRPANEDTLSSISMKVNNFNFFVNNLVKNMSNETQDKKLNYQEIIENVSDSYLWFYEAQMTLLGYYKSFLKDFPLNDKIYPDGLFNNIQTLLETSFRFLNILGYCFYDFDHPWVEENCDGTNLYPDDLIQIDTLSMDAPLHQVLLMAIDMSEIHADCEGTPIELPADMFRIITSLREQQTDASELEKDSRHYLEEEFISAADNIDDVVEDLIPILHNLSQSNKEHDHKIDYPENFFANLVDVLEFTTTNVVCFLQGKLIAQQSSTDQNKDLETLRTRISPFHFVAESECN